MSDEDSSSRKDSCTDLLDDGGNTSTIIDPDTDESALLDTALGEDNGEVEGDGELSLLDQDESQESVQIDDPEIEAIKARVKEMEEEAEKLKEMQGEVEKQLMGSKPATPNNNFPTLEEKMDSDSRSVHVANVDYQATAEELGQHFHGCGAINRVTILCDKYTGHPKGFAYIEFSDQDSLKNAIALDESLFRGRQIKVTAKRTNRPGLTTTNRGRGRGRGRGFRGGGMMMGFNPYLGGYVVPMPYRGRGRSFRGRAKSNWYAPY